MSKKDAGISDSPLPNPAKTKQSVPSKMSEVSLPINCRVLHIEYTTAIGLRSPHLSLGTPLLQARPLGERLMPLAGSPQKCRLRRWHVPQNTCARVLHPLDNVHSVASCRSHDSLSLCSAQFLSEAAWPSPTVGNVPNRGLLRMCLIVCVWLWKLAWD